MINELYFKTDLFLDLSKLDLNIEIKFDTINTLDKITQIYIFYDEYYKTDILYKLDEDDIFIKIIKKSNIMKLHYNLKDTYMIYYLKNNINDKKINNLTDFIKTNKEYNLIFNEEIIIKC